MSESPPPPFWYTPLEGSVEYAETVVPEDVGVPQAALPTRRVLRRFRVELVDHGDFPTGLPAATIMIVEYSMEAAEAQARNLIHTFADGARATIIPSHLTEE